jgi:ArsR family transcriptional regulator, arsenate/arsenite/antimonite-responsive transcriptional repressor
MDRIVEIMKGSSDPTRIRILMVLKKHELCVCQITAVLNLAPSTISKHISILKHAGLVKSRKDGKLIYYRLAVLPERTVECKVLQLLKTELDSSKQIIADRVRLENILSEGVEEVCAKVCCRKK